MAGHTKWGMIKAKYQDDPAHRARVAREKRALDIAVALSEMRERLGLTQREIADRLGTSQPNISRIEHDGDIFLSTLFDYVDAAGGELHVRVTLPDGSSLDLLSSSETNGAKTTPEQPQIAGD